jgi:hypothetical protein
MEEGSKFCQYYYRDLALTTLPDTRLALALRRYWWTLKRDVWHTSVLGLRGFASREFSLTRLGKLAFGEKKKVVAATAGQILNLKLGDWVEVRSAREIFATLDAKGKLKGLAFTPEMMKFCGRRFKVYKKLNKIVLEATGELRKIKTPTVLLEGVFCDGNAHGGCDRSCFCFWREEWLKRASPSSSKVAINGERVGEDISRL